MKASWDRAIDVATIALDESGFPARTASRYLCGPGDEDQHIALHFDARDVLIGVTIQNAGRTLPECMRDAEKDPTQCLRVRWDRSSDGASVHLSEISPGELARSHPCDPLKVEGMIILGFRKDGTLLDIEVLDATRFLPKSVLDAAEIIG